MMWCFVAWTHVLPPCFRNVPSFKTLSGDYQEIAAELGSSCEVISRVLEGFAGDGLIRLSCGMVEILDYEFLSEVSAA